MWGSLYRTGDFSGYQIELVLLLISCIILAIWVFYHSDKYFYHRFRHIFWLLTLFTGPIGLLIYLLFRKSKGEL